MNFSVVIPTHNRRATLRQCLNALLAQTHPAHEVIVVDDGSSDGTAEMMARDFPTVRYLWQQNAGPASARNHGIHEATGDIIAFTDDDCLPPADWLERLADGFRRHPDVAGVGGALIAPESVLDTNTFAQYERYVAQHIYHVNDLEMVGGFECPAGGTANMSYRKSVLLEVGCFDTTFPVPAGEDADLKLRICQKGYMLLYVAIWMIHLQNYNWERFRQQCYVRGIGRNYFEHLHGAGYPSRLKIALRVARRLLDFPLDLWRMPRWELALVKLADGFITCKGQWDGRWIRTPTP